MHHAPGQLQQPTVQVESIHSDSDHPDKDREHDVGDWCGPSPGDTPSVAMHRAQAGRPKEKGSRGKKNEDWKSISSAQPSSEGWFPTDIETAYQASVRHPHGTSLLIDTGSPNNIGSDGWAEGHARELQRAGLLAQTYEQMAKPLVCSGIGHGAQQADQKGS